MKTTDAPALMVKAGSGTQMINYRLSGNDTYVTDRLFDKAVLVAGVVVVLVHAPRVRTMIAAAHALKVPTRAR